MNILVTGAAGFIGSNLVDALLAQNHMVTGIDDFNDFYDPQLKWQYLKKALENPRFTLIEADIRDPKLFDWTFSQKKPDVVVHLAARAGVRPSLNDPQLYYDVNLMGSLNLLEAMKKNEIKQLVYASSSSVYGNRSKGPFKEIDSTDQQVSPYGATKKALEGLVATYSSLYGIKATGLRFFTAYGPRNRPNMACSLFLQALNEDKLITQFGDGKTGRDYTYIDDIVAGLIKTIETPFDHEIINLGNSSPVLLSELIQTCEQVTKKKAKIKIESMQPGDVVFTFADISKAKKLLGWEPKTNLTEGLAKLYQWMHKQKAYK